MRDNYYRPLTEARERLSKENPGMSKYEVLGKAREESGAQRSIIFSVTTELACTKISQDIAITRYLFMMMSSS